jgi:hypothetical protein
MSEIEKKEKNNGLILGLASNRTGLDWVKFKLRPIDLLTKSAT